MGNWDIASKCPNSKTETRVCSCCGKKGHLALRFGDPTREFDEEESPDIVGRPCSSDEDVGVTQTVLIEKEKQEIPNKIRRKKNLQSKRQLPVRLGGRKSKADTG